MAIAKRKLYLLLAMICGAGYLWLSVHLFSGPKQRSLELCMIKRTTGVPCASCGSTRAALATLHGDFMTALAINPLGVVLLLVLLLLPFWLLFDVVKKRATLYHCYIYLEKKIIQPKIAIPLIALMVANWVWNIYKGL